MIFATLFGPANRLLFKLMLNVLSRFPLFHDLDEEEIRLLIPFFSVLEYQEGEVLFNQGDAANDLFLVLSGKVAIKYKPYDGPEITLATVHSGGIVGWSAVLGNTSYTSRAVCLMNCDLIAIKGNDLRQLTQDQPEVGRLVLERLSMVASTRWSNAREQVFSMLVNGLSGNGYHSRKGEVPVATTPSNHTIIEQLKALIEQLSAYVEQFHGGTVDFVSYDGSILKVHLGGACLGCPLSPATLHGWVAGTVRQFFPDIEHIEAV